MQLDDPMVCRAAQWRCVVRHTSPQRFPL